MSDQLCPECVRELMPQSKKLGQLSRWMVCPECGYRERPLSESSISKQSHDFSARIKETNQNKTKFNSELFQKPYL